MVDKYLSIYKTVQEGISCGDFCRDIAPEYLEAGVVESMDEIISCAKPMLGSGVKIAFDPTLVRGM